MYLDTNMFHQTNYFKMYRPLPKQLTIKNSPIEGLGLYAVEEIKEKREQRYYDKRMKVKKVQEKYQAKLDIKQNIHLVEPDVVRSKAQVNEAEKMQIVDTRKAATGSSRRRSARK